MKHPKVKTLDYMRSHFKEFVHPNGACWDWNGAPEKLWGYGRIKIEGSQIKAHRLSWILFRGEIPADKGVLHKCDRPICVNPNHLFLGDNLDNQRDCIEKGRKLAKRGESSHFAKLTQPEVNEIRTFLPTLKNVEIGRRYAVSHATISDIRCGRTWKAQQK